ncbi:hypothetical protein [Mycobacterium sp. MMS18-G62]
MLAIVITSPGEPPQTHEAVSVGIAHEVTDTVSTDSPSPDQSDADAPKQVTIALGAVAMVAVVGLAFSRRKSRGPDRW